MPVWTPGIMWILAFASVRWKTTPPHHPPDIAWFLESLRGHPVTWGGHTEGRRLGPPGIAQLSCWGGRRGGAGVWGMINLFLLHWEEMVNK